jgi:small subunit ribosomal protein S24e
MDIEILDEEANPMLHRTDVRFALTHEDATPSRLSVRDSLAARLNKNADEVVIRKLDAKFGMARTLGYAKVYQSASDATGVEQTYMLDRNKIGADAETDTEE